MMMERKLGETWLVLGASSPIARAFALEAARQGCDIVLAARDRGEIERSAADIRIRTGRQADAIAFDATDDAGHATFVATCRARCDTLNVFLAFGFNPPQSAVERDPALARRVIETNYLGAVLLLDQLLPVFEAQRRGHVIVLGSVAGDRGRLKNYTYGSAKAGLHAYLQGLRARLSRCGVSVTTIKPGFVDTPMTWGMPGLFLVASPETVARQCWRLAQRGADSAYVPRFWALIMAIIKAIPERIFKFLSI